MEEVKEEMEKIRKKEFPSIVEIRKYVRYLINVEKHDLEMIHEMLQKWPKEELEKAIKEVERENSKPHPKRYYVSLKEPLE